jgi:hypothetical protein
MPRIPELFLSKTAMPDCIELRRRLRELRRRQPPADPSAPSIRIGLENTQGDLVDVVETTGLVEAVKVFEILGECGWEPGRGHCRASDGRALTRTYREPH